MLFHVHKDATEQIHLQVVVAEFIGRNKRRKLCFGNIIIIIIVIVYKYFIRRSLQVGLLYHSEFMT